MKFSVKNIFFCFVLVGVLSACSTRPAPLTYLAYELPKGPIVATNQELEKEYSRGGFYFWNWGFRPAADVETYVKETQKETGSTVLHNADVDLKIPFAIDILFFGYNFGTDRVWLGMPKK